MVSKREARIRKYEKFKDGLAEHVRRTEADIRKLPRLSKAERDKLIAAVRKDYRRIMKRVDYNQSVELKSS